MRAATTTKEDDMAHGVLTETVSGLTQAEARAVAFSPDPEHGLTISQWCGDLTLDDHCQHTDPASIANATLNAILALETSFQHHTETLAPHIAPGCSSQETIYCEARGHRPSRGLPRE